VLQRKKLATTIGATLERRTTAYFKGLTTKAAAEDTDFEDILSAASQEMDFDQP
jgi:hypothetical protein